MLSGLQKKLRTARSKSVSRSSNGQTYAILFVAVVLVFTLGDFVGAGRIHFGKTGLGNATGLPSTLNYTTVNDVYAALRQNYNGTLSESQVLDGLKHGIAIATADPYTEYFTPKEATDFSSQLQGTISGIGAQLEVDDSGNVVVMSPIDGSPAAAAGLRAQDIIASIDGKSTSGMTANDAVLKIRGQKGTKVTLGIIRDKTRTLMLTITRDTIQVPTASSRLLDNNVGYLQVSQFSDDTYGLVQKAVASFQSKGVKKIVLDLRDDPGGEVTTAQNISSLWLPKGTLIMQDKHGTTVLDTYRSISDGPLQNIPTVVLVNAGSASASEITALALKDNKAATILGVTSYGKGVVQQVIPFTDGAELKVTVAKWYSPNGTNINKKGITPDQIVKMTEDDYKNGSDPQLVAAQAYLDK